MERDLISLRCLSAQLVADIEKSSYSNVRRVLRDPSLISEQDPFNEPEINNNRTVNLLPLEDKSHSGVTGYIPGNETSTECVKSFNSDTLGSDDVRVLNLMDSQDVSNSKEDADSQKSDEGYPSTNDSDYQVWRHSASPIEDSVGGEEHIVSHWMPEPDQSLNSEYYEQDKDEGKTPCYANIDTFGDTSNFVVDDGILRSDPTSSEHVDVIDSYATEFMKQTGKQVERDKLTEDTYQVCSERLIIITPKDNKEKQSVSKSADVESNLDKNASETEELLSRAIDEGSTDTTQPSNRVLHRKKLVNSGVDFIARNKQGFNHFKSQGSYSYIHGSKFKQVPKSIDRPQKIQQETLESLEINNPTSTDSARLEYFGTTETASTLSLSNSWHNQPLPPIGEIGNGAPGIQSAPADLYKLSYLIQEERRKLQQLGMQVPNYLTNQPHPYFVPSVAQITPTVHPHYDQQHSYPSSFTKTQEHDDRFGYANDVRIPVSSETLKNGKRNPQKEKLTYAPAKSLNLHTESLLSTQKEYADIVRRHHNNVPFTFMPKKSRSVPLEDVKESKRSVALSYSKSVPKPVIRPRRATKRLDSQMPVGNLSAIEIMKRRHEEEKHEVDRLRKHLSFQLRGGR